MGSDYHLFEISWEVCNKVGGIHTVVSTKAKTLVSALQDRYVCIGPWLLSEEKELRQFNESSEHEGFVEACREIGIPIRIGRWRIPGEPITILVEFSGLFAKKNEVLATLWEKFKVDSLSGGWDYVEPVMFGHAAGMVIEKWWQEFQAPRRARVVAQFHEWLTGSGLLYVKNKVPAIGTVFTTHATMLGRSIAGTGSAPLAGLAGRTPEEAATAMGLQAKHSLESVCARESDVFTTVSQITADEAEVFHGRRAAPLLPNGIDLEVMDEISGGSSPESVSDALRGLARRFLGDELKDAAFLCISGRYEPHNKGIDLLIDAMALLDQKSGQRVVLFILVPAGNSGIRNEVLDRLRQPEEVCQGPIGLSTHNLFDAEHDPVQQQCARLGLKNATGARVKIIHIPIYLNGSDGLLNLTHEAVMRAMDLTCFPSFYEPWGYTPEESLALGVPTVTTDYAGFGRWAEQQGLGPEQGVFILKRENVPYADSARNLADTIEGFLNSRVEKSRMFEICRHTAQKTAWSDLVNHYYEAFEHALKESLARTEQAGAAAFRPKVAVPLVPRRRGERPHLLNFEVAASLREPLTRLKDLAQNYWWSWDLEGASLFEEISPQRWEICGHNPVRFLREVFPEDLERKAADEAYLAKLERVLQRFRNYMEATKSDFPLGSGERISTKNPVAYFCAEFGLHESLHIYSGGLGILAGDHLKSASDINLPLVAVGLFYRKGYLEQRITNAGDQLALESDNDPRNLPMDLLRDERGRPIEIRLQLPSSEVALHAWEVKVGRVRLFLLDSNVEGNRPEDSKITELLYGGDQEMRLRQEIVLGKGGVRLLSKLGLEPSVWHMNEGHAAFLALERISQLIKSEGITFDEARELVRSTSVFTTHTPVPAGHDRFDEDLIRRYFSDAPQWVGLPWERFFALGETEEDKNGFNMTYLALQICSYCNGVSKLHGEVSRNLLHPFWPKLLRTEVPIHSITNGIHLPSWTHPEVQKLLAADVRSITGEDYQERSSSLDLAKLWEVRKRAKVELLEVVKTNLQDSFVVRHDSPLLLNRILEDLTDDALLIGFARRVAPYKRTHLLFSDIDRLAAIVNSQERPVRFLFAGKSHPRDGRGQEILKRVFQTSRHEKLVGKVIFLENYDLDLARHLVQGVDVWLNNPIRPMEASGTSGMKVSANGGLNLSVIDGWWAEGYGGSNGWAIGNGQRHENQDLQDQLDCGDLYRLLEEEVVPLFFERDDSGIPRRWMRLVRNNLLTIPVFFNTDRMVSEYRDRAYAPLARKFFDLVKDKLQLARTNAINHARIRKEFPEIQVVSANVADLSDLKVGDRVEVHVEVNLGSLAPEEVVVELIVGHTNGSVDLHNMVVVQLSHVGEPAPRVHAFEGSHPIRRSGTFAYGIRVRAREEGPQDLTLKDLVIWA